MVKNWILVTHNGMDISEIIPLLVTHSISFNGILNVDFLDIRNQIISKRILNTKIFETIALSFNFLSPVLIWKYFSRIEGKNGRIPKVI